MTWTVFYLSRQELASRGEYQSFRAVYRWRAPRVKQEQEEPLQLVCIKEEGVWRQADNT